MRVGEHVDERPADRSVGPRIERAYLRRRYKFEGRVNVNLRRGDGPTHRNWNANSDRFSAPLQAPFERVQGAERNAN